MHGMRTVTSEAAATGEDVAVTEDLQGKELRGQLVLRVFVTLRRRWRSWTATDGWWWTLALGQMLHELLLIPKWSSVS